MPAPNALALAALDAAGVDAKAGLLGIALDADLPLRAAPAAVEQGFRPAFEALLARGWPVSSGVDGIGPAPPEAGVTNAVVMLSRDRRLGRAQWASAWDRLPEGGCVVAVAHNDEGARGYERDVAQVMTLDGRLGKHHGRAFWCRKGVATDEGALARWRVDGQAAPDPETGLWTRAGVFNEGRLDLGSRLLLEHLPVLGGRVADLGAGSGLLARAVLAAGGALQSLDLFEAEARALDLAGRHLGGATVPVGLHWHDVASGVPGRYDAIVCNPPFHVGSRGVPALGQAFIAAAADALEPDGELWLVANRHLPYEDALRQRFGRGELVVEAGGFKVFRAWAPQAAA